MKLLDALKLAQANARSPGEPFNVALVCGFTPLHLETFLTAELSTAIAVRCIKIRTGRFGDTLGALAALEAGELDAAAVVLEWSDLDGRLGTRQLGGWGPSNLGAVVEHARTWLAHVRDLLLNISVPTAVVLPSLPLPPLFYTAGWQSSEHELELRESVAAFASSISRNRRVRVVSQQRLDEISPPGARLDAKNEWAAGLPYTPAHASAVAQLLTANIQNRMPKKGLITDLDETCWHGIVGEVGVDEICWDLDGHAQQHGYYQQLLSTLADEGVLIAVASKNDPSVVEDAFARRDLLITKDRIFPFDVSWGPKSAAVSRILSAWNIAAGDVIFVDDSPAELAEVKTTHPAVECLLFPKNDPQRVYELCVHLRDLFGKPAVSEDDALRMQSLRATAEIRAGSSTEGFSDTLLEHAGAHLVLNFQKHAGDARAFELLNKTNQFNLTGKRISEAEWQRWLERDDTFVMTASYTDSFGRLGKIAVLSGCRAASQVCVHHWVMSCRAFGRRIEHQCLKAIFDTFSADKIAFNYVETTRNGPVADFFAGLVSRPQEGIFEIDRETFGRNCPKLFHAVTIAS